MEICESKLTFEDGLKKSTLAASNALCCWSALIVLFIFGYFHRTIWVLYFVIFIVTVLITGHVLVNLIVRVIGY